MSEVKENNSAEPVNNTDKTRREFLRKSAYAAYATPVIMAMLVNKANADSRSYQHNHGVNGVPNTNTNTTP